MSIRSCMESSASSIAGGERYRPVSDKHVLPVVTVFDDLKEYLSDSDISLDYRIASLRKKNNRRHKSLDHDDRPTAAMARRDNVLSETSNRGGLESTRRSENDTHRRLAEMSPVREERIRDNFVSSQPALIENERVVKTSCGFINNNQSYAEVHGKNRPRSKSIGSKLSYFSENPVHEESSYPTGNLTY